MRSFLLFILLVTAIYSQSEQQTAYNDLNKIDSLYSTLNKWMDTTWMWSYKKSSPESERLLAKATMAKANWSKQYPIYARLLDQQHTTSKKLNVLKGAGTIQILAGSAGLIGTIYDANRTEIRKDIVRVLNSKGTQIGSKTQETPITHEWTSLHTITIILSCGLILSGSITIAF